MASIVPHSVADDRDLDDADLWAVIDSVVASHSASKSFKSLAIKSPNFQSLSPISNPLSSSKLSKNPKTPNSSSSDTKSRVSAQGEVMQEPWVYRLPQKVARTCASKASRTSPLIVIKNVQRTLTTLVYSSRKQYFSGRFPSVSLFKEYQNTTMAVYELGFGRRKWDGK